jgi:hypothetical protein
MHDLSTIHMAGFALYAATIFAGPIIWIQQGRTALREAGKLGVDDPF